MPPLGIAVSGVRGSLDERAAIAGKVRLTVRSGRLRLSGEALARLLPPNLPVRLDRLERGRLFLRTQFTGIGGTAEIAPQVTSAGRLRLAIVSFQAGGILPIPVSAVLFALRTFVPTLPGVTFGQGDQLEIDLAEAVRPLGIALGPLRGARVGDDSVELEF